MTIPSLDPDLLQAFVAVAEHLSFTRAANVLNRTQSAVSMQIKRLEDRLGVELFFRTRFAVQLSPAGEGLLGYAVRILALNNEAVKALSERKVEGGVRLAVMEDYGARYLPRILNDFATDYPRVVVDMETGLTSTLLKKLGDTFDIVIAMHPEGVGGGELLRREHAVWASSALHKIEGCHPLPVALAPIGCLFRQWTLEALDRAGRPWRLAFTSQSIGAIEAIVNEGLAVTVVKAGAFPAHLRRLSTSDGLPELPAADVRLHRAPSSSRAALLLGDRILRTLPRSFDVSALEESSTHANMREIAVDHSDV